MGTVEAEQPIPLTALSLLLPTQPISVPELKKILSGNQCSKKATKDLEVPKASKAVKRLSSRVGLALVETNTFYGRLLTGKHMALLVKPKKRMLNLRLKAPTQELADSLLGEICSVLI